MANGPFKMKGSPAKMGSIQGTAGHASALKQIVKGGTKTWEEGMESSGGTLNKLVKQREGLDKGSTKYAAIQNQINKALGSKKRHGVTTTTEGKTTTKTTPGVKTTATKTTRGGKKVKKTTDTDTYTKTSKFKGSGKKDQGATVSGVEGVRKAKTRTKYKDKDRDVKLKTKYDKSGEVTKEKKTVKEDDVVTKTITKGTGDDVTKRVKVRRKGGTGLGAKIKGVFSKKTKTY